jgi:hypothetical protein
MPWGAGALLLLLLGSVFLAFRMLFFPPLLRKSLNTYLLLTRCTLIVYLIAAAFILFSAWVDVGISDGAPSATEVLGWIGIGVWLILAGLVLAHIGGILLKRQETRAVG